jgi:hypothetical protein
MTDTADAELEFYIAGHLLALMEMTDPRYHTIRDTVRTLARRIADEERERYKAREEPKDTRPHCCKCRPDYCYTSDSYATPCEEYGRCKDHALAAAIKRISRWGMDGWVIECDSSDSTAYRVTINGYDPRTSGLHPTLHEAIEKALTDD